MIQIAGATPILSHCVTLRLFSKLCPSFPCYHRGLPENTDDACVAAGARGVPDRARRAAPGLRFGKAEGGQRDRRRGDARVCGSCLAADGRR